MMNNSKECEPSLISKKDGSWRWPRGPVALEFPCSVAADGDGNIIISDSENPRIRKIAAEGAEEEDAADVPDVVDPDSDDDSVTGVRGVMGASSGAGGAAGKQTEEEEEL